MQNPRTSPSGGIGGEREGRKRKNDNNHPHYGLSAMPRGIPHTSLRPNFLGILKFQQKMLHSGQDSIVDLCTVSC